MDRHNYKILSWNVRGLNSRTKQKDARQMVNMSRPDLACLQETKIEEMTVECIRNTLGAAYENNFITLPIEGARGSIVLATNADLLKLSNLIQSAHTVSADVTDLRRNRCWTISTVYGPQGDLEKRMFIRELKQLKNRGKPQWLILGDFNLIYKLQGKSNGRVNRGLMHRFKRAIDHLEVKEINLVGRKFTWSNGQIPPTMSRIDRGFCTTTWEEWHPNPILHAYSSSSDHCPLLLTPLVTPQITPRFRFESFWVDMPDFL
jgi:exonuclease III